MVFNPDLVIKKANISIASFCSNECNAYCCRTGFLVFDNVSKKLFNADESRFKVINERVSFNLVPGCPNLLHGKCIVHNHKSRPLACKLFPISIKDNLVYVSPKCTAVKAGLLYPYIRELLLHGFSLAPTNPYADFGFCQFD